MEVFASLLLVLADAVLRIDDLFLKRLRQAVPGIDELCAAPAEFLATRSVIVGPVRRPVVRTLAVGFSSVVAYLVVLLVVMAATHDFENVPPAQRQVAGWGVAVGGIVAAFVVGRWVNRKVAARSATLLLRRDGATFDCRGYSVRCPWLLFDAAGNVLQTGRRSVLFPVNADGVAGIEIERGGHPVDDAYLTRMPHLRLRPAGQMELRALYAVHGRELANLLLSVGQALSARVNPRSAAPRPQAADGPPAFSAADEPDGGRRGGWISVPLTRLAFPPRCCGCGSVVFSWIPVSAHSRSIGLGLYRTIGRDLSFRLPFCKTCSTRARWVRACAFVGTVIGICILTFCFLIVACFALDARRVGLGAALTIAAILFPFLVFPVTWRAVRRLYETVEIGTWSESAGILKIRFRNPHYARLVAAQARLGEASR